MDSSLDNAAGWQANELPTTFALQRQFQIEEANARSLLMKAQETTLPFTLTSLRAYRRKVKNATNAKDTQAAAEAAADASVSVGENTETTSIDDTSTSKRSTIPQVEREELRQHRVKVEEYEYRRGLCVHGTRTLEMEIAEMERALAELKAQAAATDVSRPTEPCGEQGSPMPTLVEESHESRTDATPSVSGKCAPSHPAALDKGVENKSEGDRDDERTHEASVSCALDTQSAHMRVAGAGHAGPVPSRSEHHLYDALVPSLEPTKLMSGVRGEASVLVAELERELSRASLLDMLRHVEASDETTTASITASVERKTEFLDSILGLASSLVSRMSGETGELCHCIRTKYSELVATVVAVNQRLALELETETAKRKSSDAINTLQSRVVNKHQQLQQEQQDANAQLAETVEKMDRETKEQHDGMEAKIADLVKDKKILEGEVKHYQLLLAKADEEKEQAMARLASSYASELDEAQRERSDLEQQMIYLKKQVARTLRESLIIRGPPVVHAEVQTDDNIIIIETNKDTGAGAAASEDMDTVVVDAVKNAQNSALSSDFAGDDNNSLGPFRQYVLLRRQGTVRPLSFVLRCVAQIYFDIQARDRNVLQKDDGFIKSSTSGTIRDPGGDRRGWRATAPGPDSDGPHSQRRTRGSEHKLRISSRMAKNGSFALCVYNWFLGMHGIRHVAESHLIDFLASVSHYQGRSTKLLQFSKLCGLFDELSDWNSFDVLEMYFMCVSALCPEGILRFFVGSSSFVHDGTFKITPFDVLDSLPKIFRELEKPDLLQTFMNDKVMSLMEGQGSTIDGDLLVNILVTEFIQKRNRTKSKLEATVLTVQQEVPDEQRNYTSFMEFKRVLDDEDVAPLPPPGAASKASVSSMHPSDATSASKADARHHHHKTKQQQVALKETAPIFGEALELFSASLRMSSSNKVQPSAVARAALKEGIIKLMRASDVFQSHIVSESGDSRATAIVSAADGAHDTSAAGLAESGPMDEAVGADIDEEDVENLVCDNLRVILNGVVELRSESFDESLKSLLEHVASPEDGDLIHDVAELNSDFKKALREMSHETSSEYVLNNDLKAKRNNSVTAFNNYKYEYEIKKGANSMIVMDHGGVSGGNAFGAGDAANVTNLADVHHAWECYRKLVYRLTNATVYLDNLNSNKSSNFGLMKNVNIAGRMNRGNSITNLLHSDERSGVRKYSVDMSNRGSIARHNSTFFGSESSFSARGSELDKVKEGGADYLTHQHQQFQIHRSQKQSSVYFAKDHQNSVYARDHNSTFGGGISQHASALITLLQ